MLERTEALAARRAEASTGSEWVRRCCFGGAAPSCRAAPSQLQYQRYEDFTSDSYTHGFYTGKIFVAVYEAGPGRVYIDGALFDEFVQILEGRLILTPDD